MKLSQIYAPVLLGLSAILLGLGFYQQQGDAAYWFEMQKRYPQGSVVEQYYLDKAIATDPTFDFALKEKSVPFNKRGLYATGFAFLNRAVDVAPIEHLGYRGYIKLYMLRDYRGALADFVRLDSLTPKVQDAPWGEDIHYVKGMCWLMLEAHQNAIDEFTHSITSITETMGEDWVDVKTFYYRALTYAKMNQLDRALADFNKAINYYDKYAEAWYHKALVEDQLDQKSAACISLKAAIKWYEQDYVYTNKYYELPHQLYASDLLASAAHFSCSNQ